MALEDGQRVTDTPASVEAGVSLTDGEDYNMQNTGGHDVFFMRASSAPDPDDVVAQFLASRR